MISRIFYLEIFTKCATSSANNEHNKKIFLWFYVNNALHGAFLMAGSVPQAVHWSCAFGRPMN